MDTRHIVRTGAIVVAAVLLLTFAFAIAPKAPGAGPAAIAVASAQESAPAAEGASATAAPAEKAEPKAEEAKGEEAKGEAKGEKKEIPHTVGNPSPAQLQDLRRAWDSIPGFDLLLISILGLIVAVGIVGFGVIKQMKA